MPDQLLWYCMRAGDRSETELDVPSWTWASILQGVCFLNTEGSKNVCNGFRFNQDTRVLAIGSILSKVPIIGASIGAENTSGCSPAFYSPPFGIV